MGKKLAALNLALIFFVGLFFWAPPAYAVDGDFKHAENYVQAQGIPTVDRDEAIAIPSAGEKAASLLAGEPYLITVNGTSFNSDVERSGAGWGYDPGSGVLELTNYSGSSISASGDLTIYTDGNVTVTGANGSTDGSTAVNVNGTLNMFIFSGTSTFRGGTGTNRYGGDGIVANELNIFSLNSASNIICQGGYGTTIGGYGIAGLDIYLATDHATIRGGNGGTQPGYGIYFFNYLEIGVCYMTVEAGHTSGSAIMTNDEEYQFYISEYCDYIDEGDRVTISPKIFMLTLNGNGGTYNNSASVAVNCRYPHPVYLGDYVFTRNGHKQVGWVSGTDFVGLGETLLLASDKSYSASWVPVDNDTVLFIANGGKINGSDYLVTADGDINIPSRNETIKTIATDTDLYLLGWTTRLTMSSNDDHILNFGYQWFLPDTEVRRGGPLTMYAEWISDGTLFITTAAGD